MTVALLARYGHYYSLPSFYSIVLGQVTCNAVQYSNFSADIWRGFFVTDAGLMASLLWFNIGLSVRACVHACVRACVRVHVHACLFRRWYCVDLLGLCSGMHLMLCLIMHNKESAEKVRWFLHAVVYNIYIDMLMAL